MCGLDCERLLRVVHRQFSAACADVRGAGLRNLGCEDPVQGGRVSSQRQQSLQP